MTLWRILACDLLALIGGLAAFSVVAAVQWPGTFRSPLTEVALVATLYYFAAPLLIASVLAWWRGYPGPFWVHLLVSLGWWLFLLHSPTRRSWSHTGAFPWSYVARAWPILPPILFAGAVFWGTSARALRKRASSTRREPSDE